MVDTPVEERTPRAFASTAATTRGGTTTNRWTNDGDHMQISPGMREALAIGIGATLGMATAGGALVALHADDDGSRRIGGIVAAAGLTTAVGIGALMLRSPTLRHDAALGALGFVGLPSLLATGVIQNRSR